MGGRPRRQSHNTERPTVTASTNEQRTSWTLITALALMLLGAIALVVVIVQGLTVGHPSKVLTWVGMIAPSASFILFLAWLITAIFRRRT